MTGAATLPLGVRLAHAPLACGLVPLQDACGRSHLAVFYPYPRGLPRVADGRRPRCSLLLTLALRRSRALRRRPYLPVGWLWYLVTLVPVIGLVQVGPQAMADRYTYVPLVGLFIAGVWGVHDLLARSALGRRALAPLALAAVAACAVLTRIQVGYWRDDVTLYEHAIAVTRDNFLAHNNLARELAQQLRFDEAKEHLVEALRIQPGYPDARTNLAGVLMRQGRMQEAIAELRTAVENTPGYAPAHRNLAALLEHAGRREEAAAHLREAERLEAGGPAL